MTTIVSDRTRTCVSRKSEGGPCTASVSPAASQVSTVPNTCERTRCVREGFMRLTGLTVENWKSFREPSHLELRPLTILLGRNNAGKSALTRLPLLLAAGFGGQVGPPLPFDLSQADVGRILPDVIYKRLAHGSVTLAADLQTQASDSLRVTFRVQNIDELKLQLLTEWSVSKNGDKVAELLWIGSDPRASIQPYRDSVSDVDILLAFDGLVPRPDQDSELTEVFTSVLSDLSEKLFVTYLGPFREQPKRSYEYPGTDPDHVGTHGAGVAGILGSDALRRQGRLVGQVADGMEDLIGPWRLAVEPSGDAFRLELVSTSDAALRINLVDVGTGVSQVMPIVVQRVMDRNQEDHDFLEVVEQPELHLHPRAHLPLADLYITGAQRTGAQFVVETHSENFVLRVRRRIAEGLFDPDLLALYYIEHDGQEATVRRIEIGPLGDVDYWPSGVFSEDYEETRHLAEAQLARDPDAG
ncbi:MAG: hypothetical protein JWN46_1987 [Acidimicrobiales bacterium]|nr:hypothetical protein [Acidimicrobiales bacterium]